MTEQTPKIWTGDDLTDVEFAAITDLLRRHRQFDLEQYKDRCIRRRIAKRLRTCSVVDIKTYLQCLETDPDELDTLLATISIHVSQFFRNPDTFQALEETILPDLCRQAKALGRRELTLWSVGCASGEEPYSLALLVDEMADPDLEIQIIATDISEPVLVMAKDALYDSLRLSEVPPAVLERYFSVEGNRFRLVERIRDKVEFTRQNIMLTDDYPAADLILCRNVLIYFSRSEQDRILTQFAKVLSNFGALVLGRSETLVGAVRQLYHPEFPVERIYRCKVES